MTKLQKKANEEYFKKAAELSTSYLWIDKAHLYEIVEGCFIAPDSQAYNDIKDITPASFHNRIKLEQRN